MKNVEGLTHTGSTRKLQTLLESKPFEWTITALIIFNAIIMGMETNKALYATGGLSVLRALRILRVLRLISVVPSLRNVVTGLISALPGMGSIIMLLTMVFYIFAVMGTNLFADDFPQWFGSLSKTSYTLFQVMTLESWSMGIVRPVMEVFPYAWLFFVIFIVCTTFTVLNLFIGIIVSAMSAEGDEAAAVERTKLSQNQQDMMDQIALLRREIASLSETNNKLLKK